MRGSRFLLFLSLTVLSCNASSNMKNTGLPENFDWQGHRGARGLKPENTVPAFLKALQYPEIRTLELDVVISGDSQVVVSHDPWMSETICSHPDGRPVAKDKARSLNLFRMTYEEIKKYDCGKRGHPGFPEQQIEAAEKPLLKDLFAAVKEYCQRNNLPMPHYNIEIKSKPEWDGVYTPAPDVFARLVFAEIEAYNDPDRICVQSFDKRSLQAMHQLAPEMTLALLLEDLGGVKAQIEELGFTPNVFSPYYKLVTAHLVQAAHESGMRIIPWTVNDSETMKSLIGLGVDGIITDYPDRIPR